jgi:rsbT antagonist protein RsbS
MRVPILRLNAKVLVVALGSDLTDDGAMEFQSDLAERTSASQARGIVIDVSALDVVDSFMARVLNDTASMLRLLGARVVVCGMKPAVAMTLVEMGCQLIAVATTFTLERALLRLEELMRDADLPGANASAAAAKSHA